MGILMASAVGVGVFGMGVALTELVAEKSRTNTANTIKLLNLISVSSKLCIMEVLHSIYNSYKIYILFGRNRDAVMGFVETGNGIGRTVRADISNRYLYFN